MFLTDSDFYTEGAFSYQGLWSQKTLGLKNRFTKDKVRKRIKTVLVEAVLKRKNKQTKNWNSLKRIRITFPPSSWKRTSTNDFLKKFKLNWKWKTSLFWAQISVDGLLKFWEYDDSYSCQKYIFSILGLQLKSKLIY